MMDQKREHVSLLELYIHIPFCVRKCSYCDFLSAPATEAVQEAYMAALFSELQGRAQEYRGYRVSSIFIGGGTPTVPKAELIEKLIGVIRENYRLQADAEISMEMNPGTVDREKLEIYRRAGINRLSIGLQSTVDGELRRLGRIHSYAQFLETYRLAREVGFSNINVDVMSGLPGQTVESWRGTLEELLRLKPMPEHISAYSLIVEEGTPFGDLAEAGKLALPDEESERLMYRETGRILEAAGFGRYEISNYAREGFECRHNCGYWLRTDYVGFGIGAASLVENRRFRNGDSLEKYLVSPMDCREDFQELTVEECMEETLFLGLRMTAGVSCDEFKNTFGRTLEAVYGEVIEKNLEDNLLEYREGGAYLALTEKGLDLSNYVMAQFLL